MNGYDQQKFSEAMDWLICSKPIEQRISGAGSALLTLETWRANIPDNLQSDFSSILDRIKVIDVSATDDIDALCTDIFSFFKQIH